MRAIDPTELRAVTSNYFFWQGLRWIPIGIAMFVVAASQLAAVSAFWMARPWLVLPAMLVAVWASTRGVGVYYRRRFGSVDSDPVLHARRSTIKWVIVYPAMLVSTIVDMRLRGPILLTGLVWAVAIELYRRSTGGGRGHYTAAAVSLAILGVLPAVGLVPTGRDGVSTLIAFLGLVYVIGGILDHRALVRILNGESR